MKRPWEFLLLAACLNTLFRMPGASPVKGASSVSNQQPSRASSTFSHDRTTNIKGASKTQTDSTSAQINPNDFQTRNDRNSVDSSIVQTSAHSGGYADFTNTEPEFGISPLNDAIQKTTAAKNDFHQTEQREYSYNSDTNSQVFSSSVREESSACDLGTGICSNRVKTSSQQGGSYSTQGSPPEPVPITRTNSQHVGTFNSQGSPYEPVQSVQTHIGPQNTEITYTQEQDAAIPLTIGQPIGRDNQGGVAQHAVQEDPLPDLNSGTNVFSSGNAAGGLRTNDIQAADGDHDHHHHHHHAGNPIDWLRESIPGQPGVDYPILYHVPATSFECDQQQFPAGIYGDMDTQCQAFHICQTNGRQDSFLCPNGTVFNQEHFVCDWWYNYQCADTLGFYALNENIYQEVDDSSYSQILNGVVNDRLVNMDRRIFDSQTYGDSSYNNFADKVQEKPQRISSQVANKPSISSSSSTGTTRLRDVQYNIRPDKTRANFPLSPSDSFEGYPGERQRGHQPSSKSNIITNQQPDTDRQLFPHGNTQHKQTTVEISAFDADNSGQSVGGSSVGLANREEYQQQSVDADFDRNVPKQEFGGDFGPSQGDERMDQVIISYANNDHSQQTIDDEEVPLDHAQEVTSQQRDDSQSHFVDDNSGSFLSGKSIGQEDSQYDQQTDELTPIIANRQDDFLQVTRHGIVSSGNKGQDYPQQAVDDQISLDRKQEATQVPETKPTSRLNNNAFNTASGDGFRSQSRRVFGQRGQNQGQTNVPETTGKSYSQSVIDTQGFLNQDREITRHQVTNMQSNTFDSSINKNLASELHVQSNFDSDHQQQRTFDANTAFKRPTAIAIPTSTGFDIRPNTQTRISQISLNRDRSRPLEQKTTLINIQNQDVTYQSSEPDGQSNFGSTHQQQQSTFDADIGSRQPTAITNPTSTAFNIRSSTKTRIPQIPSNLDRSRPFEQKTTLINIQNQDATYQSPEPIGQSNFGSTHQQQQSTFDADIVSRQPTAITNPTSTAFNIRSSTKTRIPQIPSNLDRSRPFEQKTTLINIQNQDATYQSPESIGQSNFGSTHHQQQSTFDTDIGSRQATAITHPTSTGFNVHSNTKTLSPQISSNLNRPQPLEPKHTVTNTQNPDTTYQSPETSDEAYYKQNIENYQRIEKPFSSINSQQQLEDSRADSGIQQEPEVTQHQVIDDFPVIEERNPFAQQANDERIESSTFGPYPGFDSLNTEDKVDDQTIDDKNTQFSTTETGTGRDEYTDTEQVSYGTSDIPSDISAVDDVTFTQGQTEQQPTEYEFSSGTQAGSVGTVQNNQNPTEQKTINDSGNSDSSDCDDSVTDSPNTFTEPSPGSYSDQPIYGNQPNFQAPNKQNSDGAKFNRPVEFPAASFGQNQGGFKPMSDTRRFSNGARDAKQGNHVPAYNRNQNNQPPPPRPNYQDNQNNGFHSQQEVVHQNFQQNFNNIPNRNMIPGAGGVLNLIIRKLPNDGYGPMDGPMGPGATMLLVQPQIVDDFSSYQRKQVMPLFHQNENRVPDIAPLWQTNQGFKRADDNHQTSFRNQQNTDQQGQRNYGSPFSNEERGYTRQTHHRADYPINDRPEINSRFVPRNQINQEFAHNNNNNNNNYQRNLNDDQQGFNNHQYVPDQGYVDNYSTPAPNDQVRPEPPPPEEPSADYIDRPDIDARFFGPQPPSDHELQRNPIVQSPIPTKIGSQNVSPFKDNVEAPFQQPNRNGNVNIQDQSANGEGISTPLPQQFNSGGQTNVDRHENNYGNNGEQHRPQRNLPDSISQEEYSQESATPDAPSQLSSWVGSDSWKPVVSNSQGTYRKQSNGQYIKV